MSRLEESRRRFEARLREVQQAIDSEVGTRAKGARWVVPLVGLAAGVALAWRLAARWSERRRLAAGEPPSAERSD